MVLSFIETSRLLNGIIREDGRIVGVTEELSAQEIYDMGRKVEPFVNSYGYSHGAYSFISQR